MFRDPVRSIELEFNSSLALNIAMSILEESGVDYVVDGGITIHPEGLDASWENGESDVRDYLENIFEDFHYYLVTWA